LCPQEVTTANHKKAVVWEESFTLGFDLSPDTVVQVWLPDDGTDVLQRIIESGHQVILSNGWYLDRQAPTCTTDVGDCPVHWMWIWTGRDMYQVEPLTPSSSGWTPSEEQAKLILGGEAASWGESVDDKNFDGRVWSRVPGVAERLWSPSTLNDDWEIQPRLSVLACQLARRGVQLADSQPAFCDYYSPL
jgi:hexosaminidase